MIKYLLIILPLLFSSPSWGETVTIDDLVQRNGLYYKKFTDVPFTGEVSGKESGKIKKGKIAKDGKWLKYYENGQLEKKGNFKDWKPEGFSEYYYENGQLKRFKDEKKEGLWEYFNEDGSLEKTETYKNGKLIKEKTYE